MRTAPAEIITLDEAAFRQRLRISQPTSLSQHLRRRPHWPSV